ncbi:MAG TPA: trimethylamine methyltransferase [Caldilineae bacterium]|nr:trimethylamine methyltransferase [Caldilineae bacterium]
MSPNQNRILTDTDIDLIHQTSLKLLDEVGVLFPNDEALDIFRERGVRTDGEKVFFSEKQVMDALATAPEQFILHARNPSRSVTIGDGESVFAPGYGAPLIVDMETGARAATMADYHNLAKLAQALPNMDVSGHMIVEPDDVPAESAHLHMLLANMLHSDKPFMGSTEGTLGARHTMEMTRILCGEKKDGRAMTIGLVNSLSPLSYAPDMIEAIIEYARWRQALIIAPGVMAGSTGPITLAGVLALSNAEALAGLVLAQLVGPGVPVVYGGASSHMDMQTGNMSIGGPEVRQKIAAQVQLARHYGLPARGGGALTDANAPDAQAGYESMLSLCTTVSSGVDFVLHAAGILSSYLAFSYEKFILDDEMCGMVRRTQRQVIVDAETLAYDVIASVGPGGNYLTEDHTFERCRTEFWLPDVGDRGGLHAWMNSGRERADVRAQRRWQALLAEHEDPALDEVIVRQLQDYVTAHL